MIFFLLILIAIVANQQHHHCVNAQFNPDTLQQPQQTLPTGTSSISGFAFFDDAQDGIKDSNDVDYGISEISVWLLNCDDEILKTTKTDTNGYYSFNNLPALNNDGNGGEGGGGGYYIYAPIPDWYVLTPVWNGQSITTTLNVDNVLNPDSGTSNCFELEEGEEKENVSFGLIFYVPPGVTVTEPPSPAIATPKPTNRPTMQQVVTTPNPTRPPVVASTPPPTNKPITPSPTKGIVTTPSPTKPPSQEVTLQCSDYTNSKQCRRADCKWNGSTCINNDNPSVPVAEPSSKQPTNKPITSNPTKVPTPRLGTEYGPTTTTRLQLTIRGIDDSIPNVDEWSLVTASHIENYFNNDDNVAQKGAWNVKVEINVVEVLGNDQVMALRAEKRNSLSQNINSNNNGNNEQVRRRRDTRRGRRVLQVEESDQQTNYVQIIYNQISTYTTSDILLYDDLYIATDPFATTSSQEVYITELQVMDSFYDGVTSVSGVRQIPLPGNENGNNGPGSDDGDGNDSGTTVGSEEGNNNNGDEGGGNGTAIGAALGTVCVIAILVAAGVLIMYRRRGRQLNSGEPVGNGPQSSMKQFNGSTSSINDDLESGRKKLPGEDKYLQSGTSSSSSSRKNLPLFDESLFDNLNDDTSSSSRSEKILQIIAPPGKLGVVVDTPPGGGCAYICEIKISCPIRNEVQLEDRIVAVDRDDVQKLSAVDVSKLLAKRSRNAERKITVLRKVNKDHNDDNDDDNGGGSKVDKAAPQAAAAEEAASDSLFSTSSTSLLPASPAADTTATAAATLASNEVLMDVTAPSGKLGVVLVTPEPPEVGPAYVFKIRDDSPLVNKLLLGDKVLAVDDEDVTTMSAINVSKLLGSKSGQEMRKISIKRIVDSGDDGCGQEVAVDGSTPSNNIPFNSVDDDMSGERIEIIAPPGKLGIVVDSPPEGGCAFVSDIKQECPIKRRIKLGDKLIKVDDEDVSKLKAVHVSSKSHLACHNFPICMIYMCPSYAFTL